MNRALIAELAAVSLKAQTKAAQHLETCVRCRRLFVSALEEGAEDEMALLHSLGEGELLD